MKINSDNLFKAKNVTFRGKSETNAEVSLPKHSESLMLLNGFEHHRHIIDAHVLLINIMVFTYF